ncbi:mitochondrial uncoupling protein 4 isoform X4 [Homalodisca vitripennis]|uniref:mitochondrial uncoupling protein 4 isoform X4 n=1 Tax=Homalodisca vitripennis TaxID=197043 RepID=UPI001EEA906A|nr:mitochondrial uncoupling protein 4 isoform X4 [Homalodisca vitripennis]
MSKRSLIFRSADDGKCKNSSQEWSADKMAVHNTLEHKAPQYNYADSFWCTYLVSVVAASIAEMLTYPLDLTKTRLQIQGELAAGTNGVSHAPYRGMLKTALGIVQEEGVPKLWQGVTPAIYRHVVYSGIRIVAYEKMRDNVLKKDSTGAFPIWKSAIAGVTSGALAQFIASPTDLVKVQIQMEGKRRLMGKAPSACAGLVAATMGTPADVVKTRIMNQPTDAQGRGVLYKSSIDCLMKTVHNEGAFALYKGFLPVWIRMAPWSLTFWLSFEQIRHMLGATGF